MGIRKWSETAILIFGMASAVPGGLSAALAEENDPHTLLEEVNAYLAELHAKQEQRRTGGEWVCSVFCRESHDDFFPYIDSSIAPETTVTASHARLIAAWEKLVTDAERRCARFYRGDSDPVLYLNGTPVDGIFRNRYRAGEVVIASLRNACLLDPGAGGVERASATAAKAVTEGTGAEGGPAAPSATKAAP